ncbi:hypothetical protein MPER_06536, partial [Moniliophthora perniciosa FA553]
GGGPIGLLSLLSATAAGAEPIQLVPGVHTILIDRTKSPQEQAEVIKEVAGGASTRLGGKVFIIGVGKSEQTYRYANQYPKAIRLVAGGLINLKPLVTHRFVLEDAVSAFHVAADPSSGAIKVQIQD